MTLRLLLAVLATASLGAAGVDATPALDALRPALARVDAEGRQLAPQLEDLLRRVAPEGPWELGPRQSRRGTAMVVTRQGDLWTNHHVVAGASQIRLTLPDGTTHDAELAGSDPDLDLAWLRMPVTAAAVIATSSSLQLEAGTPLLTAGFFAGDQLTVSVGVLSARTERGIVGRTRRTWLLTDAVVARGASGGPLANLQGRVVGMTTAGLEGTVEGAGLGLALPIEDVRARYEELRTSEARHLGLVVAAGASGLVVQRVLEDSAAAAAGLLAGDVLVDAAGRRLSSRPALAAASTRPGTISLSGSRDGEARSWNLLAAAAHGGATESWRGLGYRQEAHGWRMLSVDALAHRMGLDPGDLVTSVAEHAANASTPDPPGPAWLAVKGKGYVLLPAASEPSP